MTTTVLGRAAGASARGVWLLAGVVLPAAALGFELVTGMCAEMLFDPLSTRAHVVFVAAVPCVQLWLWLCAGGALPLPRWAGVMTGAVLAVSAYYALIFLPLTAVAVVAILLCGLGLLALSPLIATIVGGFVWRWLRRRGVARRSLFAGLAAGALALLAAELPAVLAAQWSSWAVSEDAALRARGLSWLRRFGDRDALLEACYRHDGPPGLLARLGDRVAPRLESERARELYFRVTGQPFEHMPKPALRGFRQDVDEQQGGREVGGVLPALSLASSRFDTSIDGDAALGYSEWTLVLRNRDAHLRAEARAEIALPAGAVVSRATLWVDGQPQEAAFAGAGEARAAYERVVRQARDPLLVTQSSPGRVLVQCFPIEPRSQMKIRIGISFPLLPIDGQRARASMPFFLDRNFELPADLAHHTWIEASGRIAASHASLRPERDGRVLRGALPAAALEQLGLEAAWTGPHPHYAVDERAQVALASSEPPVVRQTFAASASRVLRHLVVAVDTSSKLAQYAPALVDRLADVRLPLTLVLASDGPAELLRAPQAGPARRAWLAQQLAAERFAGGKDNVDALRRALEQARALHADAVLWLHGPQPRVLADPDVLNQPLARAGGGPVLVAIGFGGGPNRILRELDAALIQPPEWRGSALATLRGYLETRTQPRRGWSPQRTQIERAQLPSGTSKTSAHLVRLWAAERIAGGCAELSRAQCVALAVEQRLVTAVSGAVVLETAAQYRAANLTPGDAASVPSIPEPETWLLAGVALLALLIVERQLRARARAGAGAIA